MNILIRSMIFSSFFYFHSSIAQSYKIAESICQSSDITIFTCQIKNKTVSICGRQRENGQGKSAIFRYGRRNRTLIESTDLHLAYEGFPAGGETQVYADTAMHRYLIFDRMVRIGVDKEGHNIPLMTQGLLILSRHQNPLIHLCVEPKDVRMPFFDQEEIQRLVPIGKYIDHD